MSCPRDCTKTLGAWCRRWRCTCCARRARRAGQSRQVGSGGGGLLGTQSITRGPGLHGPGSTREGAAARLAGSSAGAALHVAAAPAGVADKPD